MATESSARRAAVLAASVAIVLGSLLGGAPAATAQTQTAVEYYYADWNFYFVTSDPDEIAALDGGAFGGVWQRTGQSFYVWPTANNPLAAPTCRFFTGTFFAPKSSHFYTPNAAECDGLRTTSPVWQFEGIAFYIQLPDDTGHCPAGTSPLLRLYNNGMGGAPNHRFTTSAATFSQMLAAGWIFEGDLRTFAFACVPACDMGRPLALLPPEPSAAPGDDFVDPVTGHRIVRLSRLANGGSGFYFHQNEFNCRGNKLVFDNAHGSLGRWLYSIDLETFAIQPLASAENYLLFEVVAPKRNEVLHLGSDWTLRATNLDTHATRTIAQLPAGASGFTINSDETLIAGMYNDAIADYKSQYPTTWIQEYFSAHKLTYLFTVDADSGAFKQIHQENNWLDHVQFSPSDPHLLMYDHQGPVDLVADEMWLIDVTGTTAPRSLYTEPDGGTYELVSHEFWSPDGRRVYFDHQYHHLQGDTSDYFIGWVEVATGAMGGYPIAKSDWGIHYNISHDGSMFASDGDYIHSSRKTLLLYRIVDGSLQVEPLADLSASDYSVEPNVHFTPDDKWVVYQEIRGSDLEVYAVSVAKNVVP